MSVFSAKSRLMPRSYVGNIDGIIEGEGFDVDDGHARVSGRQEFPF
jgi:hypothetical protein